MITNRDNAETVTQNPYTFAGTGVRDRTTGWVHYGARYYSTRTGAFTQQDTLDAPLDPANANRYAYAGGDPINLIDPTGQNAAKGCARNAAIGVGATAGATLGVNLIGLAVVGGPVAPVIGVAGYGVIAGAGCITGILS